MNKELKKDLFNIYDVIVFEDETEIKSKLLKYQQYKYGDVGLGNIRVQGM